MANERKIYVVQITTSSNQVKDFKALVTVRLHKEGTLPSCVKEIADIVNMQASVICEPPLPSRYVRIETTDGQLQLCEVQVYGAGKYKLQII